MEGSTDTITNRQGGISIMKKRATQLNRISIKRENSTEDNRQQQYTTTTSSLSYTNNNNNNNISEYQSVNQQQTISVLKNEKNEPTDDEQDEFDPLAHLDTMKSEEYDNDNMDTSPDSSSENNNNKKKNDDTKTEKDKAIEKHKEKKPRASRQPREVKRLCMMTRIRSAVRRNAFDTTERHKPLYRNRLFADTIPINRITMDALVFMSSHIDKFVVSKIMRVAHLITKNRGSNKTTSQDVRLAVKLIVGCTYTDEEIEIFKHANEINTLLTNQIMTLKLKQLRKDVPYHEIETHNKRITDFYVESSDDESDLDSGSDSETNDNNKNKETMKKELVFRNLKNYKPYTSDGSEKKKSDVSYIEAVLNARQEYKEFDSLSKTTRKNVDKHFKGLMAERIQESVKNKALNIGHAIDEVKDEVFSAITSTSLIYTKEILKIARDITMSTGRVVLTTKEDIDLAMEIMRIRCESFPMDEAIESGDFMKKDKPDWCDYIMDRVNNRSDPDEGETSIMNQMSDSKNIKRMSVLGYSDLEITKDIRDIHTRIPLDVYMMYNNSSNDNNTSSK